MSETNAATLHEATVDGRDVRVTLYDGTEFVATTNDLRDYRPLAEDTTDVRLDPPLGHLSVELGVEPDDFPSDDGGKPTYAIVDAEEQSRGGWGSLWAAWPAGETEDGRIVERSREIENVEVVSDE